MKQCVNCGMGFGDTVTTCRFCGKAVRPVAEKPKSTPKLAPQYAECTVCHFKQAPGTEKCRFCGGLCHVVNPSAVTEPKSAGNQNLVPNKREQLKAQATELGLTFAANISTEKLEKMIVEALKVREVQTTGDVKLEECTEEEIRAVATELGIEIEDADTKESIVQKIKEFTAKQNGENVDDNSGNNEADSTSGQGSGTPVDNQ